MDKESPDDQLILLLPKYVFWFPVNCYLQAYCVNNMLKSTKGMFTITLLPLQG
jgi:hypothetical protein